MNYQFVGNPELKAKITGHILRRLPNWFGIEKAIVEYASTVGDTIFIAAMNENQAVGFISLKLNNRYTGDVYVLGVLPEFHRQGIGSCLVDLAEQYLKDHGVRFMMVKTLGETHPDENYKLTRNFYYKKGFLPLEEFSEIWGKENPCLIMVKSL
jgi:ribosomal protein S18 acetylase RimI-like enzyme